MKKNLLVEVLGWYGVAAILCAYFLVSLSVLSPTGLWYQLLNFTGAIGFVIETWAKKDFQPFWLNAVWAVIAAVAILNALIHFS